MFDAHFRLPMFGPSPAVVGLGDEAQPLEITYRAATGKQSLRNIDLYALRTLKEGVIGLVANCRLRNDLRVFALDRIADIHDAKSQERLSADTLAARLAPDIRRLVLHDACLNQRTIGSAAPIEISVHKKIALPPRLPALLDLADRLSSVLPQQRQGDTLAFTLISQIRAGRPYGTVDLPAGVTTSLLQRSTHARMAVFAAKSGLARWMEAYHSALPQSPSMIAFGLSRMPSQRWAEGRIQFGLCHNHSLPVTSHSSSIRSLLVPA